jgi:two-component system phosphate regulon sensor histidine kinase PhoR
LGDGESPRSSGGNDKTQKELDQFKTILSALSDGVVAIDEKENIVFVNQKLSKMVERSDLMTSFGQTKIWEIFRDPEILSAFRKTLNEKESSKMELKYQGQVYALSITTLKEYEGAVGVFHDVTDLKKSDQIRVDFVANVSHELRTPLTVIKGYTDTLLDDVKQGKKPEPEFLEAISRNAERLLSLIGDLLDLSSLEAGQEILSALKKVYLDPREVTEKVLQQMQLKLDEKKQKIETRYSTDQVLSEPKRLEQVLFNLLDNANKYTPVGGKIEVCWEKTKNRVQLRVLDNGPGIPEEHLSRIFERFYRVDESRSREQGGTGLGLAIVKHIMQRHGGSVQVLSQLGKGTEFRCDFP